MAERTTDDLTNPARIAPRHLCDLELGVDKLLHTDINLADTQALYNFLSTFSGTHVVSPRACQVQVGVTF